jgi:hypothetical protein
MLITPRVSEAAAGECQIEPSGRGHAVEVEAGHVEGIRDVLGRGHQIPAKAIIIGGEPQLDSRPIPVILKPVVAVRTAAEVGVVVRCDQIRVPLGSFVRGAGGGQKRFGISRINATEQPSALGRNRSQLQGRTCGGPMNHTLSGVFVRPARHR